MNLKTLVLAALGTFAAALPTKTKLQEDVHPVTPNDVFELHTTSTALVVAENYHDHADSTHNTSDMMVRAMDSCGEFGGSCSSWNSWEWTWEEKHWYIHRLSTALTSHGVANAQLRSTSETNKCIYHWWHPVGRGFCLDRGSVSSTGHWQSIMWGCSVSNWNQNWKLTGTELDKVQIKLGDECLYYYDSRTVKKGWTNLYFGYCSGRNTYFRLIEKSSTEIQIMPKDDDLPKFCVEASAEYRSRPKLRGCDGSSNQRWQPMNSVERSC